MTEEDEHLTPTYTTQGYKWLPMINGLYGDAVQVYESSLASQPALWLRIAGASQDTGRRNHMQLWRQVHLSADAAVELAQQLLWMVEHHYQNDEQPPLEGNGR